jgi:hypothetical protein
MLFTEAQYTLHLTEKGAKVELADRKRRNDSRGAIAWN